MILESCQAISKASSFVCGHDLRDSAAATVMFKVGVVSYRLQDYDYVIQPRVTAMVLCSRFQCLCIPIGFFAQILNLYLFFSFKPLESEN